MTVLDVSVLPGFVAVILLFLIPPGPDMAYLVAVGLDRGRRAALQAILGIGTGMGIHAAAVVVGMGRLARSYPLLLHGVQVLGAAYLVWLAFTTIRDARRTATGPGGVPTGRPYLRGVLVSVTNPKVLLFFLSVLPQFMGSAQHAALQLAMLGGVNILAEVVLYGTIGVTAGSFHARFGSSRRAATVSSYVAGCVYVALAGVVVAEVLSG